MNSKCPVGATSATSPSEFLGLGLGFLRDAEVPLKREVLTLSVTVHALTVAPELRVVWGKQEQTSGDPITEGLKSLLVTPDSFEIPMGFNRAEVDDADMTDGLDLFALGILHLNLAHWPSCTENAKDTRPQTADFHPVVMGLRSV